MSEQTANGRNANGRRFRLYELIIAGLLAAFFAAVIAFDQRTANRVDELDRKLDEKVAELGRKVDENTRQIAEMRIILAEVQNTLKLLVSGLNVRIEPKEQAGPGGAPAPSEKLATKDP